MYDNIEQLLNQKSIRITPMRQLLLAHFLAYQKSFGLTELEQAFPKADRTTIYRTLKTFEENGIIHAIENGVSEVKYALCHTDCSPAHHIDQHPHFQCIKCNQLTCLENVFIPKIELPTHYISIETQMTIKGICKTCAG